MTDRQPMAHPTAPEPGRSRGPLGPIVLGSLVVVAIVGSLLLTGVLGGQTPKDRDLSTRDLRSRQVRNRRLGSGPTANPSHDGARGIADRRFHTDSPRLSRARAPCRAYPSRSRPGRSPATS